MHESRGARTGNLESARRSTQVSRPSLVRHPCRPARALVSPVVKRAEEFAVTLAAYPTPLPPSALGGSFALSATKQHILSQYGQPQPQQAQMTGMGGMRYYGGGGGGGGMMQPRQTGYGGGMMQPQQTGYGGGMMMPQQTGYGGGYGGYGGAQGGYY